MADIFKSPLHSLRAGNDESVLLFKNDKLSLSECDGRHLILLQSHATGDFLNRAAAVLGCALPNQDKPFTEDDPSCLLVNEDSWVVSYKGRESLTRDLAVALEGQDMALSPATSAWAILQLEGRGARELLARGCNEDLHPNQFQSGQFCATQIARIPVYLYRRQQSDQFDLYVGRSFAMDLWRWLTQTAKDIA